MTVPSAALFRWRLWLIAAAGLVGASGVVAAALAAHSAGGAQLATASQFLLIHAVAALAVAACSVFGRWPAAWLGVASVLLGAAVLFSGDVALFTLRGLHLFPMAAPTGGTLLIVAWLSIFGLGAWEALAAPR